MDVSSSDTNPNSASGEPENYSSTVNHCNRANSSNNHDAESGMAHESLSNSVTQSLNVTFETRQVHMNTKYQTLFSQKPYLTQHLIESVGENTDIEHQTLEDLGKECVSVDVNHFRQDMGQQNTDRNSLSPSNDCDTMESNCSELNENVDAIEDKMVTSDQDFNEPPFQTIGDIIQKYLPKDFKMERRSRIFNYDCPNPETENLVIDEDIPLMKIYQFVSHFTPPYKAQRNNLDYSPDLKNHTTTSSACNLTWNSFNNPSLQMPSSKELLPHSSTSRDVNILANDTFPITTLLESLILKLFLLTFRTAQVKFLLEI
ncbi:hypothetical protein CEXT_734791 [Caerostris extrusa]|uniref:Uncharacterized protein n=1 Tax=Caerostris extrusa TaxID=172846 RepID=A0AAV4MLU2_CAEEX|nr:hypothetical protein CEXT_734791 [Caerostris extrusa]